MTVVLGARGTWCRPGEQILWLTRGELDSAVFEVKGRDKQGRPKKGLGARMAKGALLGALAVADVVSDQNDAADDDRADRRTDAHPGWMVARAESGGLTVPPAVVVRGAAADCIAAQTVAPYAHRDLPGWQKLSGWFVLTPQRFAWLVFADVKRKLDKDDPTEKKSLLGKAVAAGVNVAHLAGEVAGAVVGGELSDKPAPEPAESVRVRPPELAAAFEFERSAIAGIDPVPEFGLRVSFVDGSCVELHFGPRTGPAVLSMTRGA